MLPNFGGSDLLYRKVPMYAAISSASSRVNDMFGIFGCGSRRKKASFPALKFALFASDTNDGVASLPLSWVLETRDRTHTNAAPDENHIGIRCEHRLDQASNKRHHETDDQDTRFEKAGCLRGVGRSVRPNVHRG
jgi:hypothetical protein